MEPRLKSGIWVQALIRRCDRAAIGVAVVAHGDADAGAILLKLSRRDTGCTVSRRLSFNRIAPASASPCATTATPIAARSQRRISAWTQIPLLSRGSILPGATAATGARSPRYRGRGGSPRD